VKEARFKEVRKKKSRKKGKKEKRVFLQVLFGVKKVERSFEKRKE
jgi:hypothetical protein